MTMQPNPITSWFQRHLQDPRVVIFAALLLVGFGIALFKANVLLPVLVFGRLGGVFFAFPLATLMS